MTTGNAGALQACGLAKRFGRTVALRGLDLEAAPGERVAVFGPNGSGKTTLLRILAGLTRPSRGQVTIDGLDYRRGGDLLRRRVGVVAHNPYLYEDLTAEENLLFYARMFDLPNAQQRVDAVLAQAGMERRRRDRVRTLSRGMQQRIAIARAVLHDPDVLLMDEPDTGLDQEAASRLGEWLERDGGPRRTVLLSTHDLRLGLRCADRFVVLAAGRLAHQGSCPGQEPQAFEEQYQRYASLPATHEQSLSPGGRG